MINKKTLIDAVYINNSGGKILLKYLIEKILSKKLENHFFFLLDVRLSCDCLDYISESNKLAIKGSEANRKKFYKDKGLKFTTIFCFANVPPPLRLKDKKVIIFFHNALILDNKAKNYSLLQKILFHIKKNYIRFRSGSNYIWIVQTNHMKNLLKNKLSINCENIKILPIYDVQKFLDLNLQLEVNYNNYLYVADGVSQKNHRLLLKAWEVLYDNYRMFPVLHLTIPPNYLSLISEIKRLKDKGVLIINHGYCIIDELKTLYSKCNYFLMPSLSESFGLPLIEAASAGCEIIGANLPYVFDVVEPLLTFNPNKVNDLIECILTEKKANRKTKLLVKNEIDSLLTLLTNNAKK